jgi:hypothetical protein
MELINLMLLGAEGYIMKIGQFIRAEVAFHENDGRNKVRPCLILDIARSPSGQMVALCAPCSSKTNKSHGNVEVCLSEHETSRVGIQGETVVRFSKKSIVAIQENQVTNVYEKYTKLSSTAVRSIQNAAKSIGIIL